MCQDHIFFLSLLLLQYPLCEIHSLFYRDIFAQMKVIVWLFLFLQQSISYQCRKYSLRTAIRSIRSTNHNDVSIRFCNIALRYMPLDMSFILLLNGKHGHGPIQQYVLADLYSWLDLTSSYPSSYTNSTSK
jgi:hypothetical protein